MKLRIISAIGLIIGFFMPWLNYQGYRLSGYELIQIQRESVKVLESSSVDFWYFIYFLIPFFCVMVVVIELVGHGTGPLAGLAGIFVFLMMYDLVGTDFIYQFRDVVQLLDKGFYTSFVCAIGLVITSRMQVFRNRKQYKMTDTQQRFKDEMKGYDQ